MASSLVSVPQYAQTGPCKPSNQSRCDCMDRPGERRKLGTEPAECLRDLRATKYQVRVNEDLTYQVAKLLFKRSKIDAKITAWGQFRARRTAWAGRGLLSGTLASTTNPTSDRRDEP